MWSGYTGRPGAIYCINNPQYTIFDVMDTFKNTYLLSSIPPQADKY